MVARSLRQYVSTTLPARAAPAAVLYTALVLPALVDLAFAGHRTAPVDTVASLGAGLLVVWWFAAPLSLADAGRRLEAGPDDTSDDPKLVDRLAVALPTGLALAAAGWLALELAGRLGPLDAVLTDGAVTYARLRLVGLPGLAALFVFARHADLPGRRLPLLAALLVLNAANLGLNVLREPLFGAGLLSFEAGLAAATVVSTGLAVALLVAVAIRNGEDRLQNGWSPDHSVDAATDYVSPLLVWLVPLAGLLGLLCLTTVADQAATAEAVDAVRAHFPDDYPDLSAVDAVPMAAALVGDWSEYLAASRPPLFVASASLVAAISALWVAMSFAMATAAARRAASSLHSRSPRRAEDRVWADLLTTFVPVGALALPLIVVPETLLSLVTNAPELVGVAAPPLRLVAAHSLFVATAVVMVSVHVAIGATRFAVAALIGATAATAGLATLCELAFSLRFMGISWAVTLGATATAAALTVNFWLGNWKPADE